jgi:(1->4)-alpha-D-glucan 1-alpha-D-glucosylmutase
MAIPGIPTATYRIQLTKDFDFDKTAAIVPYLKSLGISHLYASPFMKARAGSTHGYDVVDHTLINPELGGDEGFERLSAALKQH